jgi:hypothetical protein
MASLNHLGDIDCDIPFFDVAVSFRLNQDDPPQGGLVRFPSQIVTNQWRGYPGVPGFEYSPRWLLLNLSC